MANEFLNLDKLVGDKKEIQLNGKKYTVESISVQTMLEFYKKLEEVNDDDVELGLAIELFYKISPEAREDNAFDSMNIDQINALIKYIFGEKSVEKNTPKKTAAAKKK